MTQSRRHVQICPNLSRPADTPPARSGAGACESDARRAGGEDLFIVGRSGQIAETMLYADVVFPRGKLLRTWRGLGNGNRCAQVEAW